MEPTRISMMKTRVSLAVCLLDSFTLGPPLGSNTKIALEEMLAKPVVKAQGYYIFTDLQEGMYRLRVLVQHYFEEYVDIRVGPKDQLVHVSLTPRPSYPFHDKATLLRVNVKNAGGAPCSGASLLAVPLTEEVSRARLAQDHAGRGENELMLGSVTGKIGIGDRFLIRGRNAKADEELCCVAAVLEHQRKVRLVEPLNGSYSRGSLLLPVVKSRSDEQGEAVLAFANCRAKQFDLRLDITYGDLSLLKEVNLAEGGTTLAGSLCLDPSVTPSKASKGNT
ncbi:hypothetical protein OB236_05935 [Paenibacillus sp. WQ 127069]|uniref:Carboxypeptidase regulatory-like domain-containing protein n=1 Tax=Paenibacillus baimaensis TaxID=2982185 RepID=A0ABT2UCK7_9BACL|nr:hypothetical protein [Paenibacillus sp. WQ 127069]MCU6791667.1 hypothetical protein [Paenibacillus sp. WQ 127069]